MPIAPDPLIIGMAIGIREISWLEEDSPATSAREGVVNFRLLLFVRFDGQFFPLTTEGQEFQNI
jgi:hypothetical protein